LAGLDPDIDRGINLKVSYKPQTLAPKFESTVYDLMYEKLKGIWLKSEIFK